MSTMGNVAPCEETTNQAAVVIEVMSFNIRYGTADDGADRWEKRRDQVFDLLREQAPDVIGLQEALGFQIAEILDAVPGYAAIGIGREEGGEGEHSDILYRTDRFTVDASGTFWLSDTPETPSRTWGNVCIRICTWARLVDKASGRTFYHYNTHLDHESQPSREKAIRLIVQRMRGRSHSDPAILTGDFNAGEDNPAVTFLAGVPRVDTFRVLHPDAQDVGTFHGFTGRTGGAKIDYIFASPDTRVRSAGILHTHRDNHYPSDHFPVFATLEL